MQQLHALRSIANVRQEGRRPLDHFMPKRKINPALKRVLLREFPDMELDNLDVGPLPLKWLRNAGGYSGERNAMLMG